MKISVVRSTATDGDVPHLRCIRGVHYKPDGDPVVLCPGCRTPTTVMSTTGHYRRHVCAGYTCDVTGEEWLGCKKGRNKDDKIVSYLWKGIAS